MNDPNATRLLSVGEIFDRAVHVVLRNFLQLTLAYGIFNIPFVALQDWIQRSAQARFDLALGTVVANPRLISQFFRLSQDPTKKSLASDWIFIALGLAVSVLAACLVANLTERILRGERPAAVQVIPKSLRVLYRLVAQQFAIVFIAFLIFIVIVIIWALPALMWPAARSPAVLTAAISLSAALLFCALEAWGYCAFGAVALDDSGVVRAMRTGWRMTMTKAAVSRSFVFGFGILAFDVLAVIFSFALAGFAVDVTHQVVVARVLEVLLGVAIATFVNVAGTIFYLDANARYSAIQDAAQNRENSAAR
ncbi:MAG TPA: hypothetical protein VKT51_08435 [Candidatus Eremiobacteraceae bacterium]|nr:hypothetical protein [Candidatus Eremiobacteraceae bacterium]